jgi:hypothetical protein
MHQTFRRKHKANGAQNVELNCKKKRRIRLCTASFAQQLQQQGGVEMDSLVSG